MPSFRLRSLGQGRTSVWRASIIALLTCACIALLCGGYFVVIAQPQALQRAASIRFEPFPRDTAIEGGPSFDPSQLVASIPYDRSRAFFEVTPKQRIELALRRGIGNCSNRVFGLAAFLRTQGLAYTIVHFLPLANYLEGGGHTVVQGRFEVGTDRASKILDIDAGGYPTADGSYVNFERLHELLSADSSKLALRSLTRFSKFKPSYYSHSDDTVILGQIGSGDVDEYFLFIERIHVPLGNAKLERLVYNGLALLAGVYPPLYVDPEDYGRVVADAHFRTAFWIGRMFVLSARLAIVLLAAVVLGRAIALLRARIRARGIVATSEV